MREWRNSGVLRTARDATLVRPISSRSCEKTQRSVGKQKNDISASRLSNLTSTFDCQEYGMVTSKVSIQSDRKYPSDSCFTSGRWTVTDRKPCPTITCDRFQFNLDPMRPRFYSIAYNVMQCQSSRARFLTSERVTSVEWRLPSHTEGIPMASMRSRAVCNSTRCSSVICASNVSTCDGSCAL